MSYDTVMPKRRPEPMKPCTYRLPADLDKALRRRAKAEGRTPSDVVRDLLVQGLETERATLEDVLAEVRALRAEVVRSARKRKAKRGTR